jgi:phosphotransferase system enzyme I (PtsP)
LARRDFPSEEEQAILYEKIVVAAENRPVTIRTLDVGGDKFLSYLDFPKEQNPYLGWRSIRVSLDMDEIFRTQIRAILRVSPLGDVRIMFPMITSVKEVQRVMVILAEEKEVLRSRGVAYDEKIPAGIMVEVPAAVRILKYLLDRVDFVSIGTNDLVQYILAVDRNNEKVASLYDPLHPAVIEVIAEIVALCRLKGKTVTICGEAASNPVCGYLFVAMGADRLSMNAAAIPVMKDFLRKVSLKEAKATLERIKTMDDTDAISEHMAAVIADIQREETYPARAVHR